MSTAGRGAAWALAIVGPGLLLGAFVGLGLADTPPAPETAMIVETREIGVAVIGNSQAQAAVDTARLSKALGVPAESFAHPQSSMPETWAFFLRDVLGSGVRPRVVVLPMALEHLLDTRPFGSRHDGLMADPRVANDPDLQRLVYGRGTGVFGRALSKTRAWKQGFIPWVSAFPARIRHGERGEETLAAARKSVFGEIAGEQFVERRGSPLGEAEAERPVGAVADSLLPVLARRCKAEGIRLVVTTLPQLSARLSSEAAVLREVAEVLQAEGADLVHLETLPIPIDGWRDGGHMEANGRHVFTDALAASLTELGALQGGSGGQVPLVLPPETVVRSGFPPVPVLGPAQPGADACTFALPIEGGAGVADNVLAELGLGRSSPLRLRLRGVDFDLHKMPSKKKTCQGVAFHHEDAVHLSLPAPGDAPQPALSWEDRLPYPGENGEIWWVPAGQSITLNWEHPPNSAAGQVHLLAIRGEQAEDPGAVEINGQPAPLERWGNLAWASVPLDGPLHQLRLVAPRQADLFLRALVVESEGRRGAAIGSIEPTDHSFILEPGRNWRVEESPVRVLASGPQSQGKRVRWTVEGPLGQLTREQIVSIAPSERWAKTCAPFRIDAPKGVWIRAQPMGGGAVEAKPPEGTPMGNWDLTTLPSRVCSGHAWFLAGEPVKLVVKRLQSLVPMERLRLDLGLLLVPGAKVHVVLSARMGKERQVLVDAELTEAQLMGTPVDLPLRMPLEGAVKDLELVVEAPPEGLLLVGPSVLLPAKAAAGLWFPIEPPEVAAPETEQEGEEPTEQPVVQDE